VLHRKGGGVEDDEKNDEVVEETRITIQSLKQL
jgi:hypothetical protein